MSLEKKPNIPILAYHGLGGQWDVQSEYYRAAPLARDFIISAAVFRRHLNIILDEGYQVLKSEDFKTYLRAGSGFPEKSVVITIDDGRASAARAVEILAQIGLSALFL